MMCATWKRWLGTLPGVGVSLLPKLVCPVCWPAYSGVVSAVGLGLLISARDLMLLTMVFLIGTVFSIGFKASRRRGYGPLAVSIVASGTILEGKFYFDLASVTHAGIGLLVAASVWNSWPRRAAKASGCSVCVPAAADFNLGNVEGERAHGTQS